MRYNSCLGIFLGVRWLDLGWTHRDVHFGKTGNCLKWLEFWIAFLTEKNKTKLFVNGFYNPLPDRWAATIASQRSLKIPFLIVFAQNQNTDQQTANSFSNTLLSSFNNHPIVYTGLEKNTNLSFHINETKSRLQSLL